MIAGWSTLTKFFALLGSTTLAFLGLSGVKNSYDIYYDDNTRAFNAIPQAEVHIAPSKLPDIENYVPRNDLDNLLDRILLMAMCTLLQVKTEWANPLLFVKSSKEEREWVILMLIALQRFDGSDEC